ncbi:nuclear transport factor 2 family protein [Aeromicrobium sp. CTD01-1L150]|uniref:nuclear transport factor 2 family protein n=1 Tax=Aeromicrobium sp. CTD01-1L150 TaxID=3341830 RepID=UPI0035BF2600
MRTAPAVAAWHEVVATADLQRLDALLADEVVFRSPAVHTPQEGRALTTAYLRAALVVLGPSLSYQRELVHADSAVLEFTADLEGVQVHGIDFLRWDADDLLVEFTVMVRPLKGLQTLVELMGAELQRDSR